MALVAAGWCLAALAAAVYNIRNLLEQRRARRDAERDDLAS